MCNYLHPSTHRSMAPLGWKMLVPPGAGDEADGGERESCVLNNSQPEDCQEEMHFP